VKSSIFRFKEKLVVTLVEFLKCRHDCRSIRRVECLKNVCPIRVFRIRLTNRVFGRNQAMILDGAANESYKRLMSNSLAKVIV